MKTIIKIFICLSLIYTPYFAFASAAEKWTIEEVVYNNVGKTLSYTAEKNYGPAANDFKYKAKVPVTASVAGSTALSMFRYGLASAALYGLVEGVGWIIDNGVVKKIDKANSPDPDTNLQYLWESSTTWSKNSPDYNCKINFRGSSTAAINQFVSCANANNFPEASCSLMDINNYACRVVRADGYVYTHYRITRVINPNYDPNLTPVYIPVTPSEMGDEIINSPSAPQILPDIYSPNNPVPRPSPADVSIPISLQGVSSTLVFSWSPWCQLLSIIKPAIVASAYIGAAFIVLGLRT